MRCTKTSLSTSQSPLNRGSSVLVHTVIVDLYACDCCDTILTQTKLIMLLQPHNPQARHSYSYRQLSEIVLVELKSELLWI